MIWSFTLTPSARLRYGDLAEATDAADVYLVAESLDAARALASRYFGFPVPTGMMWQWTDWHPQSIFELYVAAQAGESNPRCAKIVGVADGVVHEVTTVGWEVHEPHPLDLFAEMAMKHAASVPQAESRGGK